MSLNSIMVEYIAIGTDRKVQQAVTKLFEENDGRIPVGNFRSALIRKFGYDVTSPVPSDREEVFLQSSFVLYRVDNSWVYEK